MAKPKPEKAPTHVWEVWDIGPLKIPRVFRWPVITVGKRGGFCVRFGDGKKTIGGAGRRPVFTSEADAARHMLGALKTRLATLDEARAAVKEAMTRARGGKV